MSHIDFQKMVMSSSNLEVTGHGSGVVSVEITDCNRPEIKSYAIVVI